MVLHIMTKDLHGLRDVRSKDALHFSQDWIKPCENVFLHDCILSGSQNLIVAINFLFFYNTHG